LSSFLLLSPLLEPSLLFFLLSVRSLLGAVAVTPPKKKKKFVKKKRWLVLMSIQFGTSKKVAVSLGHKKNKRLFKADAVACCTTLSMCLSPYIGWQVENIYSEVCGQRMICSG
jgi:hypothetical protein